MITLDTIEKNYDIRRDPKLKLGLDRVAKNLDNDVYTPGAMLERSTLGQLEKLASLFGSKEDQQAVMDKMGTNVATGGEITPGMLSEMPTYVVGMGATGFGLKIAERALLGSAGRAATLAETVAKGFAGTSSSYKVKSSITRNIINSAAWGIPGGVYQDKDSEGEMIYKLTARSAAASMGINTLFDMPGNAFASKKFAKQLTTAKEASEQIFKNDLYAVAFNGSKKDILEINQKLGFANKDTMKAKLDDIDITQYPGGVIDEDSGLVIVKDLEKASSNTDNPELAIVDVDGNFVIRSNALGEVRGKYYKHPTTGEPIFAVDKTKSKLTTEALQGEIRGKPMFLAAEYDKATMSAFDAFLNGGDVKKFYDGVQRFVHDGTRVELTDAGKNTMETSTSTKELNKQVDEIMLEVDEHMKNNPTDDRNAVINAVHGKQQTRQGPVDFSRMDIGEMIQARDVSNQIKAVSKLSNVKAETTVLGGSILTNKKVEYIQDSVSVDIWNRVQSILNDGLFAPVSILRPRKFEEIKLKLDESGNLMPESEALLEVYDMVLGTDRTADSISAENVGSVTLTGVNPSVRTGVTNALKLTLGKIKRVSKGGKEYLLKEDLDLLASNTAKTYMGLRGYKSKKGRNAPMTTELLEAEIQRVAEAIIKTENRLLNMPERISQKNTLGDVQTYAEVNPTVGKMVGKIQSQLEINGLTTEMGMEVMLSGTKKVDKPTPTTNKGSKTKDKSSQYILDESLEIQANIEFYKNPMFEPFVHALDKFSDKQLLDIMSKKDGVEAESMTPQYIVQILSDVKDIRAEIKWVKSQYGRMKKEGDFVTYPATKQSNLRIMYEGMFNPHKSKMIRSAFVPTKKSFNLSNPLEVEHAQGLLIAMLDIKREIVINGETIKADIVHNWAEFTNPDGSPMFSSRSDMVKSYWADAQRKIMDIFDDVESAPGTLTEFYLELRNNEALQKALMSGAIKDMEGFGSVNAVVDAITLTHAMHNPLAHKGYVKITGEIDGVTDGLMRSLLLSGIEHDNATGINPTHSDGVSGIDAYVANAKLLADNADKFGEGISSVIFDMISRGDAKPASFAKMYAALAGGVSESFTASLITEMFKNRQFLSGDKGMAIRNHIAKIADIDNTTIDQYIGLLDSRYKLSRETLNFESTTIDVDVRKRDATRKVLNENIDKLLKDHPQLEGYPQEAVSIVKKLRKQEELFLQEGNLQEFTQDKAFQDSILTPDEMTFLKEKVSGELIGFIQQTIDILGGETHVKQLRDAGASVEAIARAQEIADYNINIAAATEKMAVMFQGLLHAEGMIPKSRFSAELDAVAKSVAMNAVDAEVVVRQRIYQAITDMKKTHDSTYSMTISEMLDAVMYAGYKVDKLHQDWFLLRTTLPMVKTHAKGALEADFVPMFRLSSQMGMIKVNGEAKNLKAYAVRMINNPLFAIGHDSQSMRHMMSDKDGIMSVLDAVIGGPETLEAAVSSNAFSADMAVNYRLPEQLAATIAKMQAQLGEMHVDKTKAAWGYARGKGREGAEALQQEATDIKNSFDTLLDPRLVKDLLAEAEKLRTKQSKYTNEDFVVNNIQIGDASTAGKARFDPAIAVKTFDEVMDSALSTAMEKKYNYLNDVGVRDKNQNFNLLLKMIGENTMLGKDTFDLFVHIGNGTHQAGTSIGLTSGELSPSMLTELTHEVTHRVTELMGIKNQTSFTKSLESVLQGITYIDNDGVSQTIDVSNTGFVGLEEISRMFEALAFNEKLISQPEFFATAFAPEGATRYKLGDQVESRFVTVEANGKPTKLNTIEDLVGHLKQLGHEEAAKTLIDMKDTYFGVLNTSTDVKALMNGKYTTEHFQSSFAKAIADGRSDYKTSSAGIRNKWLYDNLKGSDTFGSLLLLDTQSEGLSRMAALSKGADDASTKKLAELIDVIREDFADLDSLTNKDMGHTDGVVGKMVSMGFHELIPELTSSRTFSEFMKKLNEFDLRRKDNSHVTDIIGSMTNKSKRETRQLYSSIVAGVRKVSSNSLSVKETGSASNSYQLARNLLRKVDVLESNSNVKSNQDFLVSVVAKKLDKLIAAERIKKHMNKDVKQMIETTVLADTNIKGRYTNIFNRWGDMLDDLRSTGQYDAQFGVNPTLHFKVDGHVASTVKPSDGALIAGKINGIKVEGVEVPIYILKRESNTLGGQESIMTKLDASAFEKGEIRFSHNGTEHSVNFVHDGIFDYSGRIDDAIDHSFSTAYTRNASLVEARNVRNTVAIAQTSIGLKSGVFLTKESYMKLSNEEKAIWHRLTDPRNGYGDKIEQSSVTRDIARNFGDLYIRVTSNTQLHPSKGIDYEAWIRKVVKSDGVADVMVGTVNTALGLTAVLKNLVLVGSWSTYISNMLANASIYGTLAKSSGGSTRANLATVNKEIALYNRYMKRYSKAKWENDKALMNETWNKIEGLQIYPALRDGVGVSIRSDTTRLNLDKSSIIYEIIENTSQSKASSRALKTFWLDQSSTPGNFLGSVMDQGDVKPKLMLFVNLLNSGMSQQEALTIVMSGTPQYQKNLPGSLAILENFSPFMKFSASFPQMLNYAATKNPGKLLTGLAIAHGMAKLSWMTVAGDLTSKEQWLKDNGFIHIPGTDYNRYFASSYNYFSPVSNPTDVGAMEDMFLPSAIGRALYGASNLAKLPVTNGGQED